MNPTPWRLEGRRAILSLGPLLATLDLERPGLGLRPAPLGSLGPPDVSLLGIEMGDGGAAASAGDLRDAYVRDADLMASYGAAAPAGLQWTVRWRALAAEAALGSLAGVEAMLSLHTEALDATPAVAVRSSLRRAVATPLCDASGAVRREGVVIEALGLAALYVEMVHPADYHELTWGVAGGRLETRHRLLSERLEKGVILRARLRGVFVPAAAAAAACWSAFAAAGPELGP